jgi:peroxiredoxin
MMKKFVLFLSALVLFASAPAIAVPEAGKAAPDFTATDVNGKPFKLSEHKGKIVVLEWTNAECPFVQKHYETRNMQNAQKTALDKGVEWITINSSAPGKQGHVSAEEAKKITTDAGANNTAEILDESGEIGKLYGAQTTPHMFVIDKDGNVAYMGAIDDNSSPKHDTVEGAKNYVLAAIDELAAGTPVSTPVTQPYGCAVKYAQ